MPCLYIVKSRERGRYYIGSTETVALRVAQHNEPSANPSRWTRRGAPWDLVYEREFGSKREAIRAERYVKVMKSRAFIEKLVSGEYQLPDFKD